MKLWKVRVECFRKGVMHPVVRRFLVEAPDSDEALRLGGDAAKEGDYTGFKVREVVTITVPLEI